MEYVLHRSFKSESGGTNQAEPRVKEAEPRAEKPCTIDTHGAARPLVGGTGECDALLARRLRQ